MDTSIAIIGYYWVAMIMIANLNNHDDRTQLQVGSQFADEIEQGFHDICQVYAWHMTPNFIYMPVACDSDRPTGMTPSRTYARSRFSESSGDQMGHGYYITGMILSGCGSTYLGVPLY